MKLLLHIAASILVLSSLQGCSQQSQDSMASDVNDGESAFEAIENSVADSLDKQGLLLDHDFTSYESDIVAADFQVLSGTGEKAKAEIEQRIAEIGNPSLAKQSREITVFEESTHDVVTWIYQK